MQKPSLIALTLGVILKISLYLDNVRKTKARLFQVAVYGMFRDWIGKFAVSVPETRIGLVGQNWNDGCIFTQSYWYFQFNVVRFEQFYFNVRYFIYGQFDRKLVDINHFVQISKEKRTDFKPKSRLELSHRLCGWGVRLPTDGRHPLPASHSWAAASGSSIDGGLSLLTL